MQNENQNLTHPQKKSKTAEYCHLCSQRIFQQIILQDENKNKNVGWYLCRCGYMFNIHEIEREKVFNAEYKKKYLDLKKKNERYSYYIRLYGSIIEELTYGRRMLDVGSCGGEIYRKFNQRGWLATGIDIIEGSPIHDDFETFDFDGERFDLIWMGDVIQCFNDPVLAIQKAYQLLNPHGMLFIVTPNTDLMKFDNIPNFGHWNIEHNRSFINYDILNKSLIKADRDFGSRFNVIVANLENFSQRFVSWNNMHVLVQKIKIEDIDFQAKEREVENEIGNVSGAAVDQAAE